MPSVLDEFVPRPPAVASTNRGLARRLMTNTLRPPERQDLELVARIAQLEQEGLTFRPMAELLGMPFPKLVKYTGTEKYRLFREYLQQQAQHPDESAASEKRRAERWQWDAFGGNALDYYRQAYRRHTKDDPAKGIKAGDYVDKDRAERASQLYAKSAGWTEPVPGVAKPKELKVGVIQGQMLAIAAADRKETVVRIVTTQDGTTAVEVARHETAVLGGEG